MGSDESIPARFRDVANRHADRTALTGSGRSWSYRALERRVHQVAQAIVQAVAGGNDCVAVLAGHSPEMVVATLAVIQAGKISLAIHPALPEAAARQILGDARPVLVLATTECSARAEALAAGVCPVIVLEAIVEETGSLVAPHVGPDDLASIVYTSGSTGSPKGVSRNHRMVLHRVMLADEHDAITPSDRLSLLTHVAFAAAEVDVFGALLSGATLSVFDLARHSFPRVSEWIERERITVLHPPVLWFRRFLASLVGKELFPRVRLIALAGDAVLPSDVALWQRRFARGGVLTQRFSATETGLLTVRRIAHDDDTDAPFALAGWPVAGKVLTLIDDQGAPAQAGEVGRLEVRSRYLAAGYWRHPDETRAAFELDVDGSGECTYRTGDYGRFLSDGRFVFLGRRDQQVKIRGYRVDVREIEAALATLASVKEVAVVPYTAEDEQRLLAFVVPAHPELPDTVSLRRTLETLLPPWKVPSRFQLLPSLPVTLTGKVDRQHLEALAKRSEHAAAPAPASSLMPSLTLEEQLRALWCTAIGVTDVGVDDDFSAVGGDSISAMTILVEIERRYGASLGPDTLLGGARVRELAERIRNTAGARDWQANGAGDTPVGPAPLVPIQPEGNKPPFFLVHGWGGGVLPLLELGRALGPGQPTYGLQAILPDGSLMQPRSLEEVARAHVARMLTLDPHGPYYLGGYSLGGIIAYETARQLVDAGKVVGLLAVFDATPSNLPWGLSFKVHARHWLSRVTYHGHQIMTGNVPRRLSYLGGRIETVTRLARGKRPHEASESDPFAVAAGQYRPRGFGGPVVLFVAESQKKDLESAWRHLVSQSLEVERISGSHDTLLDSTRLPELAAALRQHLEKAHASDRRCSDTALFC